MCRSPRSFSRLVCALIARKGSFSTSNAARSSTLFATFRPPELEESLSACRGRRWESKDASRSLGKSGASSEEWMEYGTPARRDFSRGLASDSPSASCGARELGTSKNSFVPGFRKGARRACGVYLFIALQLASCVGLPCRTNRLRSKVPCLC